MGDRSTASSSADDGLAEITTRCQPMVARICRSRLSGFPVADIEDAVQETFLQLAQADYRRILNVEAWLIAVALRVCAHALRARYRSREIPFPDSPLIDPGDGGIEHTDEQLWLAKVAGLLPTADLKILHMLYVQDLPYGEIAKYFGVSNDHARVLAYRARQHARIVIEGLE